MLGRRRTAWHEVPSPAGRRRRASAPGGLAVVAALALLIVGVVGMLGVTAAGRPADPGSAASTAGEVSGPLTTLGGAVRPIPHVFISGVLLVTLLTTSALTIRVARRPPRRAR
jgi:hypothetical protein